MRLLKSININDIKIPEAFLKKSPRPDKYQRHLDEYNATGNIELITLYDDYLIDGYISYLILKEKGYTGDVNYIDAGKDKKSKRLVKNLGGYEKIIPKPSYKTQPTLYVFAKHPGIDREYVWRATNNLLDYLHVDAGDPILVATGHGIKKVYVTHMEVLSTPPVSTRVKKVINILPKETDNE